jgi:predicted DNA-binding antitoxin AbrB/MazE fold protein
MLRGDPQCFLRPFQTREGVQGCHGNTVDAVYEKGVFRPLPPLGLAEHEHVSTVIKTTPSSGSPQFDIAYPETFQAELVHAAPATP